MEHVQQTILALLHLEDQRPFLTPRQREAIARACEAVSVVRRLRVRQVGCACTPRGELDARMLQLLDDYRERANAPLPREE